MVNSAMPNPNHPRLSLGMALKQSIGRRYNIFTDLKTSGFNVDHEVLR
jgi:hypothetical protein